MRSEYEPIVNAILRREAVLLTGAGFSRALTDEFGDALPTGAELAKSIWPIAFGDEEFDNATDLRLVYSAAKAKSQTLLREQLERLFQVDRNCIPKRYQSWFALPWHRIYTLNIDDVDDAVAESVPGSQLQIVSTRGLTPGSIQSDRLPVIHINGRLGEFPDVTFSPWEFAERTAEVDPWYLEFTTDLATRPVVVVGSVLDEPPLWHYLTLRGDRGTSKELRPRSWLVTPRLDIGKKTFLENLNFQHIPFTEEEFFTNVVAPNETQLLEAGKIPDATPVSDALLDVSESVRGATRGSPDYLLGSNPTWGDITNGYSASFEFDERLMDAIDALKEGTVGVIGSAGSGKTSSLMRAAAVLAARGNQVLWIARETELLISKLRIEIIDRQPDYLFIDDVDRFGGESSHLLRGLQKDSDSLVTVVAARSARFYSLRYDSNLHLDDLLKQSRLTDPDAAALVSQLDRAKRLGAMVTLSDDERIQKITGRDDRQLIVTLIEATSGQNFHDKIADECRSLEGVARMLYGALCVSVWADNKPLAKHELLLIAGRSFQANESLEGLRRLEKAQLLRNTEHGYQPRHRVVAESSIDYFRSEGLLGSWLVDLIYLAAMRVDPNSGRKSRSRFGRLLIRLISHDNLKKLVGDVATIHEIYGAVESWLDRDYHFWLQRGSFEIDCGNLRAAENFLQQARALAGKEVLVDTAWAMLLLKRSLLMPSSPEAPIRAEEAFDLLIPIMQNQHNESPHTFAVYLNHGLRWLQEGQLGFEDQRKLRQNLYDFGRSGSYRFPNSDEVQRASKHTKKWLLLNGPTLKGE